MGRMNRKRHGELENILKGIASHRRIQVLELLYYEPDLSVLDIAEKLNVDFRTVSQHTRRLAQAGLVAKRHEGSSVRHSITERGKSILLFCRTIE
jgi:DNA-binding MarR family transcriptional regulator